MTQFRTTPDWYKKHMEKFPGAKVEDFPEEKSLPAAKGEKKHKYNVRPKEERTSDGIVFDSAREMKFYNNLVLGQKAGEISFFLRQVPIRFRSGAAYWCDFLVFFPDGHFTFYEVKGVKTDIYKLKLRMLREEYPEIVITEV